MIYQLFEGHSYIGALGFGFKLTIYGLIVARSFIWWLLVDDLLIIGSSARHNKFNNHMKRYFLEMLVGTQATINFKPSRSRMKRLHSWGIQRRRDTDSSKFTTVECFSKKTTLPNTCRFGAQILRVEPVFQWHEMARLAEPADSSEVAGSVVRWTTISIAVTNTRLFLDQL